MNIEEAVSVVPSIRQLNWQKLEFYAFIHFGMNTFYDREWGDGTENPAVFNPLRLDAEQWVKTVSDAGMKGLILTCKHHDGFCLWPSKYTEHSIKNSPYKKGRGDIVREVSDACRKYGIKFGVYLSPWDRNNESYGYSEEYNDYFVNQLTELLTDYGEVFCLWLDGACGEGANGKKQSYDWFRYYDTVRALQENTVISVCGPDVRWCGNEAGDYRKSEWSVVPTYLAQAEWVESKSQKKDVESFRSQKLSSSELDLGSRDVISHEDELIWYPAEVNTSIRPGWFYHESEDNSLRSLENLKDIYINTVGGNSAFLLNIPPNSDGLIHENDANRLMQLGDFIRDTFKNDIAQGLEITASSSVEGHLIENILDPDEEKYWKAPDGNESAKITVNFGRKVEFDYVVLQEYITLSQRIEKFSLYSDCVSDDNLLYRAEVIGYKKICRVKKTFTDTIILVIEGSRIAPTLSSLKVFCSY